MKTIKYINRRGTVKQRGTANSALQWDNKTLDRFVLEAAAKRHVNGFVIPPLHFLNEILVSGQSPPFEWKPFKIDETEYRQLVELLTTDPDLNVVTDNEFDNAKNLWDWKMRIGKKYRHKQHRS